MNAAFLAMACLAVGQTESPIKVQETEDHVLIETGALQAKINKKGYVSGIAAGSFLDKKTGARDPGFGLHIMDFLLGPGWKDDAYTREPKYHGNLPKHYIEGPQICTQARKLAPEVIRGKDFVAVRLKFRFSEGHNGYKAGSLWEQVLVFRPGQRWFLSSERITSANDVDNLIYRIDMPGHVRHKDLDSFEHIYLSYAGKIPAKEFTKPFPPDGKFLYQRKEGEKLDRMIRAYHLKVDGKPGPWLAGLTLDPGATVEAWCHERGYVCFIQELHGKKVRAGESFGAAYIVGYFDDIAEMEAVYDRHKGATRIVIEGENYRLQ